MPRASLSFAAFIGLWQLLIVVFDPNPILFPGPGEVGEEFVDAAWPTARMWPAVSNSM